MRVNITTYCTLSIAGKTLDEAALCYESSFQFDMLNYTQLIRNLR